jgi:hypothetical protein
VPVASITGRVMVIPEELSAINIYYGDNVPKYYIEVEEINISACDEADSAIISIAITCL